MARRKLFCFSSKFDSRLLWASLCVMLLFVLAGTEDSYGQVPFNDVFSDGNAQDGMPVTWIFDEGGMSFGSLIEVQDGDLIIENSGFGAGAGPEGVVLGDISTRAQARLASGRAIGLASRRNFGEPFDTYYFELDSNGGVVLGIGTYMGDSIRLDSD
jgi:hypothetical protein